MGMADMNSTAYRKELRMFRGALTDANPGGRRTLRDGYQWYNVYAQDDLSLYIELSNLYLKGFRNGGGTYRFYKMPGTAALTRDIINATELPFLDSYNGNGGREGIGLDQSVARTITLANVNDALGVMAAADFGTKIKDSQRLAIARVVIALCEGARFKDVENAIVAGTPITDRKWDKHVNQAAVLIQNR
jgi:hypothetical protein